MANELGMSVRTVIRHERGQSLRMHWRLAWKLRELELARSTDLAALPAAIKGRTGSPLSTVSTQVIRTEMESVSRLRSYDHPLPAGPSHSSPHMS